MWVAGPQMFLPVARSGDGVAEWPVSVRLLSLWNSSENAPGVDSWGLSSEILVCGSSLIPQPSWYLAWTCHSEFECQS